MKKTEVTFLSTLIKAPLKQNPQPLGFLITHISTTSSSSRLHSPERLQPADLRRPPGAPLPPAQAGNSAGGHDLGGGLRHLRALFDPRVVGRRLQLLLQVSAAGQPSGALRQGVHRLTAGLKGAIGPKKGVKRGGFSFMRRF